MGHYTPASGRPDAGPRLTAEQQELVTRNAGLAFEVARRFARGRLRHHDYQDLRSEAVLGLCRAAATFDPDRTTDLHGEPRKVKFSTYGYYGARNRLCSYTESLTAGSRRAAATLEHYATGDLARMLPAPDPDEHDPDREEMVRSVYAAVATLPDRLRLIVERRLDGDTLAAIGRAMGVTKERVRQLETRAHGVLRAALEGRDA